MPQDSQPILNLEQAKDYFIKMGCSHFHLAREDFQRRDEYYALNISATLETQWRKEDFEQRLASFKFVDPEDTGWLYSRLCGLVESNAFCLERMLELTNENQLSIPPDQIGVVLNSIIGSDGSKTHGGLIEKSFKIRRRDLAQGFVNNVRSMLKRAEDANTSLNGLRGNLVDIIKHFRMKESAAYLKELIKKNNSENFEYYKAGAGEENIYAMRMLARHYIKGLGCEVNREQAKFWLSRAADLGNKLAKTELLNLEKKSWINWRIFFSKK